jgi:hypothetical protein
VLVGQGLAEHHRKNEDAEAKARFGGLKIQSGKTMAGTSKAKRTRELGVVNITNVGFRGSGEFVHAAEM